MRLGLNNVLAKWPTPDLKGARELAERNPLAVAFILSLIIHLFMYQGYLVSKRLGWWNYQPSWLAQLLTKKPSAAQLAALQKKREALEAQKQREILMRFMEVPPDRATPEPPKDAKFYGAANAKAANPDPTIDTPIPKIDGKQTKIERVETVPREEREKFPLTPTPPKDQAKVALEAQPKPRPAETPGDLAFRRPEERKVVNDGTSESRDYTRPRTLQEARARRNLTVGDRMKQTGGVRSVGRVAVDVKATAFGAYDAAFIAAVQDRWYNILDAYPYSLRSGKVMLKFKLMNDGKIRELTAREETVGELQSLFCQRAILEPAPYAPWPSDMRRMIGDNYREVTFTFYYN